MFNVSLQRRILDSVMEKEICIVFGVWIFEQRVSLLSHLLHDLNKTISLEIKN